MLACFLCTFPSAPSEPCAHPTPTARRCLCITGPWLHGFLMIDILSSEIEPKAFCVEKDSLSKLPRLALSSFCSQVAGLPMRPCLKNRNKKKWKRKTDCWPNHLSGSQDVLLTGFPSARVLPRSLVKTNKTQNKPVSVSVWLRPGCQGCTCLCCESQHARKGVRNSNSLSLETEVKFPDYVCCSRSFSGLPLALKGVCAQNLRSPFSVAARLAALERRSRKERDQGISGTFFPRTGDLGLLADMLFPREVLQGPWIWEQSAAIENSSRSSIAQAITVRNIS